MDKKIKNLSFEEALTALEGELRTLESGKASLEASIEAFTKGTELAAHCQMKLNEAEKKIQQLIETADGVEQVPFDVQ